VLDIQAKVVEDLRAQIARHSDEAFPRSMVDERIFIELMTSDRKLKASREGSK